MKKKSEVILLKDLAIVVSGDRDLIIEEVQTIINQNE